MLQACKARSTKREDSRSARRVCEQRRHLLGGHNRQVSLSDLDKMLAVNVRSVYIGIQAAARHMAEGGRIVTIGSIVAQRTAVPGASTYS